MLEQTELMSLLSKSSRVLPISLVASVRITQRKVLIVEIKAWLIRQALLDSM